MGGRLSLLPDQPTWVRARCVRHRTVLSLSSRSKAGQKTVQTVSPKGVPVNFDTGRSRRMIYAGSNEVQITHVAKGLLN
jgi:hypothetical protein